MYSMATKGHWRQSSFRQRRLACAISRPWTSSFLHDERSPQERNMLSRLVAFTDRAGADRLPVPGNLRGGPPMLRSIERKFPSPFRPLPYALNIAIHAMKPVPPWSRRPRNPPPCPCNYSGSSGASALGLRARGLVTFGGFGGSLPTRRASTVVTIRVP
jgi:hypothetical protein